MPSKGRRKADKNDPHTKLTPELDISTASQSMRAQFKLPENSTTPENIHIKRVKVEAVLKHRDPTVSNSSGAKRKLLDEDITSKGNPVKRSKPNQDQCMPIPNSHGNEPGQKTIISPQTDSEDGHYRSAPHLATDRGPQDNKEGEEPMVSVHEQAKSSQSADQDDPRVIDAADAPGDNVCTVMSSPEIICKPRWQALPKETQNLRDKYQFSTMSILSSSKIESRVRNLLGRTADSAFQKAGTKPEVVILSAKGNVAGKLTSIIEIAKAAIKGEKGRWWQYTKLHGEPPDLIPRQLQRTGDQKTLTSSGKERVENGLVESKGIDEMEIDSWEKNPTEERTIDSDTDVEEGFETMSDPKLRNSGVDLGRAICETKIRNIPVMTVFFARVALPRLKELFG